MHLGLLKEGWLANRLVTLALRTQLDKLVGIAMLVAASFVFLYYTFWTLFMVGCSFLNKLTFAILRGPLT